MRHSPLLVYNRIDHNRKTVRRLLVTFVLATLPVVSAGAVFLVPIAAVTGGILAYVVYGEGLEARIEALDRALSTGTISTLFDLPREMLLIIGAVVGAAAAATIVGLVGVTAFLIARYAARMVLRLAGARPASRDRDFELFRVVENLCIGAGLPVPAIFVIESDAPNAFATGSTPANASLAVTRDLLELLDLRELEGVIAHELSHIGNHDIRLTTTLTAVVGTLSLPLRVVTAPLRAAFQLHAAIGALVGLMAVTSMVGGLASAVMEIARGELGAELPRFLRWWGIHAMLAPIYAVLVAPIVALVIRQAVSRQREFLADADAALLTRDPEGLANALAKIGAAGRQQLRASEASAHLYFVDPHGTSLLHRIFPSHPPIEQRIALLARMGSGIVDAELRS
jgi:heat shock protein HtpX